jgi:hypothetical protein
MSRMRIKANNGMDVGAILALTRRVRVRVAQRLATPHNANQHSFLIPTHQHIKHIKHVASL